MKVSLVAIVFAALATCHGAAASYIGSCKNCRLEKRSAAWLSGDDEAPVLLCDCAAGGGKSNPSRLDLNQCIANVKGVLTPRKGGNHGASCNMFSLADGKIYSASCGK